MKRVLITGGAGFVGSNLAERLLRMGRPVFILDNLSRAGVDRNLRYLRATYGELVQAHVKDVRDRRIVEELVARCRSVLHFAAQVAVTKSLIDPVEQGISQLHQWLLDGVQSGMSQVRE